MQRASRFVLIMGVLVAGAPGLVSAQAVETPALPAADEGIAEMQRRIVGVVGAIIDYTRDVRLTEAGLEAVLEHHASINEIYDDGDGSRLVERAFVDGRYDFDAIVSGPGLRGLESRAGPRARGVLPRAAAAPGPPDARRRA